MKTILLFMMTVCASFMVAAQRDQVHKAYDEKYGVAGREQLEKWMENMGNVKIEPEYVFQIGMTTHIISYKKGQKKDEMDLHYFFNTSANRLAMKGLNENKKKGDEMTIIYDYTPNAMIMLNEKDKTGFAMNINAFMSAEAQQKRGDGGGAGGSNNTDCRKTGKTKTIRGYSCEEYVCEDKSEGTRSEVWVSKKIPFDISQTGARGPFASMFKSVKAIGGGMMMECIMYKNDEKEMEMQVTDVNENANLTIKSSDYKFTSMGGMR